MNSNKDLLQPLKENDDHDDVDDFLAINTNFTIRDSIA